MEEHPTYSQPYKCPRCGRNDLPLRMFFLHDASCSFESGLGESVLQRIDEQVQRIETLEIALQEAVTTIHWLGARIPPDVEYDARGIARAIQGYLRILKVKAGDFMCSQCNGIFSMEHFSHPPMVCRWCTVV